MVLQFAFICGKVSDMKKIKKGKVDYSALNKKPEDHELYAADYFAELGFDVVFIRPSNIKGSKKS